MPRRRVVAGKRELCRQRDRKHAAAEPSGPDRRSQWTSRVGT